MYRILSAITLLLLIFSTGKSQLPTEGLVSHWPFTGNANDAGPGANHGTVNGATLVADRFGNPDKAYYFNGSSNITVPHNISLNMSGEMSISIWVKPDQIQTSGNRMILGKSNYSSNTNYLVRVRPSGYIQFEYRNYTNSNTDPLTAGNWHHILMTAAGPNSTKKIYINGQLVSVESTSDGPFGEVTNPLTFGYASYGSEYFRGAIDDIRLYSHELSSTEATALFLEGNCNNYNGIYGVKESELTYLINDDFESDVTGQLPSGWVIIHNGTATADQKVTDQVARNGTKSFETSGSSGWSATITKTSSSMPAQVVFESWVRPEKVLAAYTGRIALGNMNVGTWGTLSATVDFRNGRIEASLSGGVIYDLMPFNAGEWYHVKIVADNSTKTFQVHINGLLAEGTYLTTTTKKFPMHATVAPTQAILSAGNGGIVKMWFDDVRIYGIPEKQVCQTGLPFIFGTQIISAGGIYSELFRSVAGCDSTLTVNLKVSSQPDLTVTDNSPEFTANETDATYQWINCANSEVLSGETGRSFTATSNGSYAVIITKGGCTDTTACFTVTTLDVVNATSIELRAYPNPTTGRITILDNNNNSVSTVIDIYSASGQRVATRTLRSGPELTIDITGQPAGVYYVKVTQGKIVRRVRIVKTNDR